MKKTIWMICGPSACGKTTYCKNKINERSVYISRDEIRFSLLAEGEDYFAHEKEVVKEFYKRVADALASDVEEIYLDATFLTPKVRRKIINMAKGKAVVIAVDMGETPEISIKRNASRTGRAFVPEAVIRDMYGRYTPPSPQEGIDEIITPR